jgi:hypothetical protein
MSEFEITKTYLLEKDGKMIHLASSQGVSRWKKDPFIFLESPGT